ncbi:MAG: hypothetical protein JST93_34665 [Acidobacteria bacterium]|nr:hypothetical protein [Acidobacteriota bacterium]
MYRLFPALALLPATLLSAAPTAQEILTKARKAIGKVDSVQTLSITGTRRMNMDSPDGARTMSRDVALDFQLPDKFLKAETLELPNGMEGPTLVEGLDGETSWRDTRNVPSGANIIIRTAPPPGAGAAQDGPAADRARTRQLRHSYLRHLLLFTLTPPAGTDLKFDVLGEAEAKDGKAWILDIAGPDGFQMRIFIDQQSNLPLMASWRALQLPKPVMRTMRVEGHQPPDAKKLENAPLPEMPKPKEVEFEMRLAEHTEFGSLRLPKVMTLSAEGALAEEFELKSAKLNPKFKADRFRK